MSTPLQLLVRSHKNFTVSWYHFEKFFDWFSRCSPTYIACYSGLEYIARQLARGFMWWFTCRVEINSRDEFYIWFIEWFSDQKFLDKYRQITVTTTYAQEGIKNSQPQLMFAPDVGSSYFYYKNTKIYMEKSRDLNRAQDTQSYYNGVFETITLSIFGFNRSILEDLVFEVRRFYYNKTSNMTIIHTVENGNWKRPGNTQPNRSLNSIFLSPGTLENLLSDLKDFLESHIWYNERGIPFRRGYLLYGPPGTGKTSLVTALAGYFGLPICSININNPDLNDDKIANLFNSIPGNQCILLIEDVDSSPAALSRDDFRNSIPHTNAVTLSGLLNAIDGVSSKPGRILFVTTNHVEILDNALYRPGRIDVKVKFELATREQLYGLFLHFYPNEINLAKTFSETVPQNTYSMAEVQSHFLNFKGDPHQAVNNSEKIGSKDDYQIKV